MKIFMEPVAILIALFIERITRSAREGALAISVSQPNTDETIRQFVCDAVQSSELTRASAALHLEIVAVVMVKFLQRLDEQLIDGNPYCSPPFQAAPAYLCLYFPHLLPHPFL